MKHQRKRRWNPAGFRRAMKNAGLTAADLADRCSSLWAPFQVSVWMIYRWRRPGDAGPSREAWSLGIDQILAAALKCRQGDFRR